MCREHDGDASDREDPVSEALLSSAEYRVLSPESRVANRERRKGRQKFFGLFMGLASGVFMLGCGYHTAGHAAQLPESVTTISIPPFKNETLTYHIGQMLTASVVREFNTRTRYKILSEGGDDSDATLHGTVLSTVATPLTYDTATGRAASVMVVVSLRVDLTDRQGKVLYQNPAYLFREQYEVSQDLSSFFEEDSPAFRRLSQDFARTLVSNILEGF